MCMCVYYCVSIFLFPFLLNVRCEFLVWKLMVHSGTLMALRKLDQRRGTELTSYFMVVFSKYIPCPLFQYLSCGF